MMVEGVVRGRKDDVAKDDHASLTVAVNHCMFAFVKSGRLVCLWTFAAACLPICTCVLASTNFKLSFTCSSSSQSEVKIFSQSVYVERGGSVAV